MNINDAVYHAIRHQVRRVLIKMTDEQIDDGLSAFVDGASSWSNCFFARALPALRLDRVKNPTVCIQQHLELESPVPVRIVWTLFDGIGKVNAMSMTKQQLRDFITDVRENRRPIEVLELLRSLDPKHQYDKEMSCATN